MPHEPHYQEWEAIETSGLCPMLRVLRYYTEYHLIQFFTFSAFYLPPCLLCNTGTYVS
jgi:hypothetical protein